MEGHGFVLVKTLRSSRHHMLLSASSRTFQISVYHLISQYTHVAWKNKLQQLWFRVQRDVKFCFEEQSLQDVELLFNVPVTKKAANPHVPLNCAIETVEWLQCIRWSECSPLLRAGL